MNIILTNSLTLFKVITCWLLINPPFRFYRLSVCLSSLDPLSVCLFVLTRSIICLSVCLFVLTRSIIRLSVCPHSIHCLFTCPLLIPIPSLVCLSSLNSLFVSGLVEVPIPEDERGDEGPCVEEQAHPAARDLHPHGRLIRIHQVQV